MSNKSKNHIESRQYHQNNNGDNIQKLYHEKKTKGKEIIYRGNEDNSSQNDDRNCIKKYYYKKDFLEQLKNKCKINSFNLVTTYPGLLVGSGYLCTTEIEEVKIGFLFDYVSGSPYIPGSEIKGMLRSYFPKNNDDPKLNYIKSLFSNNLGLKNLSFDLIKKIENNIFDNNDCFIGAFPITEGYILDFDYITPHIKSEELDNNDIFNEPSPLKMIKVKPNVSFEFCFILNDSIVEHDKEKYTLKANEKLGVFKQIILDMGVGAKTSVGFSHFALVDNNNQQTKKVPDKFFNMNYVFFNGFNSANKKEK